MVGEDRASADASVANSPRNSVTSVIDAVSGKWKIPVLWLLLPGSQRFGDLRRGIPGVTQHMLTATLRELEADGLVSRTVRAQAGLRVDYALSDRGRALFEVFEAMRRWADRWPLRG